MDDPASRTADHFFQTCLAAMLTPPDVISQLLLAGPMYLLFELGLIMASARGRGTRQER